MALVDIRFIVVFATCIFFECAASEEEGIRDK